MCISIRWLLKVGPAPDSSKSSKIMKAVYRVYGMAFLSMRYIHVQLPYRMKIYTESNSATWPGMVEFRELDISKFWFILLVI